jgi:hypothetical protein
MQTENKNKMIGGEEPEVKNKSAKVEEYFFPGGTEYVPMTVPAESFEEAKKVYERSKIKVNK